jgi:hypothetical protein
MRPFGKHNPAQGLPPTPPPGTGNKTLTDFSKEYRVDSQKILKGFSGNNVSASADMTIKQIARQNNMAPADIYTLLRQIADRHDN